MIERIHGIVIDVVRHSDRYNVVTLYTRERGRISFLSSAGAGKMARMRNARIQPLSEVASDVSFKGNRDLQILGAVTPVRVWRDLYFNPAKAAIVMFLSEFLNAFLRQSEPDESLWDYIDASLASLDCARGPVANRHLSFLVGMLDYAGIRPRLDAAAVEGGLWFDMREGSAVDAPPPHRDVVGPEDMAGLMMLSRITTSNCGRFRYTAGERKRALAGLIDYYSVHYPGLNNLKSPSILEETFS